jgi:Ca2+-binding RTX toxin-like protein
MLVLVAALTLATAASSTMRPGAAAAPAARLAANVYTGIAQGGVDRWRYLGRHSDPVNSISKDSYRVRIDFTFTVSADGALNGSGTGQYTSLKWHLKGRNGSQGNFDCQIPVQGKPFTVSVHSIGLTPPILQLTISSTDAVEHNADYNCGPNYPGLPGGDSAAGPSGDNMFACTIRGTDGNDVPNGTPGPDVICGFGGNDTINGGGGNDIIYGGLGNDTITGGSGSDSLHGNGGNDRIFGRDGQLDLIAGDAGRDTATVDKGLDTVRGVEIITR